MKSLSISQRGSMYGIFTYIYHKNQPNVGKYTIHGSYRYKKRIAEFENRGKILLLKPWFW